MKKDKPAIDNSSKGFSDWLLKQFKRKLERQSKEQIILEQVKNLKIKDKT